MFLSLASMRHALTPAAGSWSFSSRSNGGVGSSFSTANASFAVETATTCQQAVPQPFRILRWPSGRPSRLPTIRTAEAHRVVAGLEQADCRLPAEL